MMPTKVEGDTASDSGLSFLRNVLKCPSHTTVSGAMNQGLTLVHFSAQCENLCPMRWGALLVSVTKTALVEQRCGRV